MSARFRYQVLERLTEPCLAVINVLDKQFQDAAFPLDAKTEKSGRMVIQFFKEMALGYRLAAHQFAGETATLSLLNKRVGATCLHRALSCCEQLLYRSSLLFKPLEPGGWDEIHTLYAFTAQNGLETRNCEDPFGWLNRPHSIQETYKRILLMGLCDPSRLSQRAIQQVHCACELWSNRCEIAPAIGRAPEGSFTIDVNADEAPQLVQESGACLDNVDFVFDLSRLKSWLVDVMNADGGRARDISFKIAGHPPLILDSLLLRQLVATWGVRIARNHQRIPAEHSIRMLVGINGIHFMTAGEQSFSQFLEETGNEMFMRQGGSVNNWIIGSDQRFRPPVYQAQVLNQSLGGYRLRLTDMEQMHLKVGELIAVSASSVNERDAVWMIGAVRWLHSVSTTELEVGVSIIGQGVRTAAVMADTPGKRVPAARGLIIQGFTAETREQDFLLLPPFHSDCSTPLTMEWRDDMEMESSRVQLLELVDRTTEYCRFTFEAHNVSQQKVPLADAASS
ncbi:MAG: hypothetical protein QNJ40_02305 [Xanthomonadales bacterium]|nr:hypothetical protein [Xanthomonadales bacterium]